MSLPIHGYDHLTYSTNSIQLNITIIPALFQSYLYEHNQIMLKNTNQLKGAMTQKEIQSKLVQDMKKDIELKKYVKDIEDLNTKQFKILINIFKKFK